MADMIQIENNSIGMTIIPNTFIDTYMAQAPGEYVKIYLYLLRCLSTPMEALSLSSIAQALDSSEGDVRRGLLYWQDQRLLTLTMTDGAIRSICVGDSKAVSHTPKTHTTAKPSVSAHGDVPNYALADIKEFTRNPEISQLQFIAEKYLAKPLSQRDLCHLLYWNRTLHFNADLIIYLIEVCISQKQTSMHQIHETALGWYRQGVRSPEDAKQLPKQQQTPDQTLTKRVKEAMGILSRSLNDRELQYLTDWQMQFAFSVDLIIEACHRTIAKTHQPSFEYADTILKNWYDKDVKNMQQVLQEDLAFQTRKQQRQPGASAPKTTKFRNFTERKDNNRELERLLMTSDFLA